MLLNSPGLELPSSLCVQTPGCVPGSRLCTQLHYFKHMHGGRTCRCRNTATGRPSATMLTSSDIDASFFRCNPLDAHLSIFFPALQLLLQSTARRRDITSTSTRLVQAQLKRTWRCSRATSFLLLVVIGVKFRGCIDRLRQKFAGGTLRTFGLGISFLLFICVMLCRF
eukprot:jgi/Botrbrau1/10954/Bobra.0383s0009.1